MRIGFLFNHSAAHQVAHSLPIANALARLRPDIEIRVLVGGEVIGREVQRLMDKAANLTFEQLRRPARAAPAVQFLSGGAIPAERYSFLERNLDCFRELDALVVPEKTSLLLKTHFGLTDLKLIHTRHGAGDRAIGFNKASGLFDFVLLSGPKIRDRLQERGLLKPDGYAVVGYPKFDLLRSEAPKPVFDNGRPTVLYNPHPSPALSSWYGMGRAVLDYFAASDRYNLIFAPHVMLFAKRFNVSFSPLSFSRVGKVPKHIRECPHIHIDTGSQSSIDMTYTRLADIYIGDVSSQIYEFLSQPRPAIFLNPRKLEWQGNPDFAHWTSGAVAEDIAAMDRALSQGVSAPETWRDAQERLFAYTFDLGNKPSSQRAAEAIAAYMER
ncbi:hypothetical protein D6851_07300 [Altericroceibacterium spongiae]|uniref:Glycosyl transferase n=1 Tax=Altericroceibacterium spongiae TaxID=2320269 RepID=A0A420EMI9_9SPHN|nr:hypothetical protein [Altericroceibacterium spongiae]RKF21816.1 hypothetical protein D6851_07300 [Altericroceibacterium spongiae]